MRILRVVATQQAFSILKAVSKEKGHLVNQVNFTQSQSVIWRSFKVFSDLRRGRIVSITLLNTLLGFLDLLAIALMGVLASVAMDNNDGLMLNRIHDFLYGFGNVIWSKEEIIFLLLTLITLLFFLKTFLSIFFTRRILHFLSLSAANLSARLVRRLLEKQITELESRSSYETLYLLTRGVEVIALQILATFFVLISDIFLTVSIFVLIFVADPFMAILILLIFSMVGMVLYFQLHTRASRLGEENTNLNIRSNKAITEVFRSYRELVVSNRRGYYVDKISSLRKSLAHTSAELSFMPYISKYVIEFTVLFTAILISGSQFILHGSANAIETLAIFLGAGSRLAPAVLRIQQSLLQIKSSKGMANSALELIEDIGTQHKEIEVSKEFSVHHSGFTPRIRIENVSFTYPSRTSPAISDVNLDFAVGEQVAIVGPSGAGKSTLVDLLLGIIDPDSGRVTISGVSPLEAFSKWPGAVAYVPQEIFISDGTIKENLALGYNLNEISEIHFLEKIHSAVLSDYLDSLLNGLDTEVGEGGGKLSGGQRQRLGIARALITNPLLLVLDEATSSLDGETEETVTSTLNALKGKITTILIAHRLSTVMNADKIIYIADGRVQASGNFSEVRSMIPDFNNQAKLLGL